MPKISRNDSADYAEENLNMIRKQIDDAKEYLDLNPWKDENDLTIRQQKFKIASELTDKILSWNDKYMEQAGIMTVFNTVNSRKTKLRKGSYKAGIQYDLENSKQK